MLMRSDIGTRRPSRLHGVVARTTLTVRSVIVIMIIVVATMTQRGGGLHVCVGNPKHVIVG